MERKTRLQLAIEYITNHKKASKFTDILEYIKTKMELTDDEILNIVGDLFMEMNDEPSIISIGDNKWTLRDKFKYEELNPNGVDDTNDDDSNDSDNDDDDEDEGGVDFDQEDENTDTSNHNATDSEENNEEDM